MIRSLLARFSPTTRRFRQALQAHRDGRSQGRFTPMPAQMPATPLRRRLGIHFWAPKLQPSTFIHIEQVVPHLRRQARDAGLDWRITSGAALPEAPVDWLCCLKAVPPRSICSPAHTVLLINDDADRFWGHLDRFGHVVSVSSPVLASLLGTVHRRVWFVEETEPEPRIEAGALAVERCPPSARPPVLMWHGLRGSLDGLYRLRPVLETFARDVAVELAIVTDLKAMTKRWGSLKLRYVPWSVDALAATAAQARAGIVPARPTIADSYLKSAGRLRCLFALGCPAVGDARSPDVVAFSNACNLPAAHTGNQWLEALCGLWNNPLRLDEIARRGHALVSQRYATARTATQWLWFFSGGAEQPL